MRLETRNCKDLSEKDIRDHIINTHVEYSIRFELEISKGMKTYLMKDGISGLFKIGKSKDPIKRLNQLRTGNPNLSMVCFGMGTTEAELHKKFSSCRVYGEFFRLDSNQVDNIHKLIVEDVNKDTYLKTFLNSVNTLDYEIPLGKFSGYKLIDLITRDAIEYLDWFVAKGRKEVKLGMDKSKDEMFMMLDEWKRFIDSSVGYNIRFIKWNRYD